MLLKTYNCVDNQTVTTSTKGLATGSWVRVPTTSAEVKAETSYILYDAKFRPIRTFTTNYLGGYTSTDSKLDAFSGQLQYTIQKHKRTTGDSELTVKEAFTYSPQKRLLTHTHQINGGAEQLLAENTYDELGQLISKKVGNTSATPLQKVDYSYNIRGWMTAINSIANLNVGTDPADLFGFKLNYNIVEGSATAANKLYNGNIAETFWSTATDGGFVRNYGYKYDNLNRLKDATYQKSGQVTGMYNENLSYDKNGNIMNLSRYGDRDEQYLPIQIDYLQYGYATNSNKLLSVADNSNNTSGFKDGNTTGDDYVYDANGNMTMDKNKNITAITYNHLNLPTQITFGNNGNIVYIYTASGQKIKKVVTSTTPASVVTTDYLGGYQYSNTSLQFFPTAEGYVKNTPVSGTNTYSYVFNYTDHLGNTRLSYTKDTTTGSLKILEENNYYPFGLKHNSYNVDNFQQDYKYKYQGQERQDELGLNWDSFKYRNYDYAIGRFMCIDPLAQQYTYNSPYAFSENRVVDARELEGLEKYIVTGRAFIPQKTLPNPTPWSKSDSYKGDNRNFYSAKSSDFRTEQSVRLDFDNNKSKTLSNVASPSIGYDSKGKKVEESEAAKAGTITSNINKGNVGFNISATNELSKSDNPLTPSIDGNFNINITPKSDGTFDYKIDAKVNGFPAFEVWVKDEKNGGNYLIYGRNPIETGEGPGSLFDITGKNKSTLSGNSSEKKDTDGKVEFRDKKNN